MYRRPLPTASFIHRAIEFAADVKISIAGRLFLTALLAVMVMAVSGIQLARWTLFGVSPTETTRRTPDSLGAFIERLSFDYAQRSDWSFLPTDAAARKRWLVDEWIRAQYETAAATAAMSASPTLGRRLGLLDANHHYLAGVIANRAIVALASIDQVERPIRIDGVAVGYLVEARSQNPDDELAVAFIIDQQRNLLVIAIASIAISALVAALLAAHFRRPLLRLVEGARRLAESRFDTRLGIRRNDELGELAATFDHLAAQLETAERARQQWVADTSHELRTPLSVLRGQLEALQDGVRSETPESVGLMVRQVQLLTRLVDDLGELARGDDGRMRYVMAATDVWPLLTDAVASFERAVRDARLVASLGAPPARSIVLCDGGRIRQVFDNLMENCVRYTDAGGRVEIHGADIGDELRITIDDSAPGVAPSALVRLGERFFRVEGSRNRRTGGSGLGLALSGRILAAHGGGITFTASPLGGLRTILMLPLEA